MNPNPIRITQISKATINKLPLSVGVYLFKKGTKTLYIGKSISLKARLLSHLENAKLDPKEASIIKNSDTLEYLPVDSEFKALLLEAALIRKHHPKYNRRSMDDKSYLYIKITSREKFPKVSLIRRENDGKSDYFGPFPSQKDAEEIIRTVRRFFPFCRQKKMGKKPCFYAKIGLCKPCPNEVAGLADERTRLRLKTVYRQNIRQLKNVLRGKIELVLKESYDKVKDLGKKQKFEEALQLRDKILRFERLIQQKQFTSDILHNYNQSQKSLESLLHTLSICFYPPVRLKRIEAYDISNLSFSDATASMIVFTDGRADKSEYKRFKIKDKNSRSDFEMLEEIFIRRFHNNWPQSDLIVVDGGSPQVLKVKQVLMRLNKKIPLIGIAKHPDRLVIDTPGKLLILRPGVNDLGFNLIRFMRDEAHRFARKYHLLLRRKRIQI